MFILNSGVYPLRYASKIELLRSGDAFFNKLLELIDNAKDEIHLQVYIFEPDKTGEIVRDSLIKAANRGVKIFLVLDAFGSKNISKEWLKHFFDNRVEIHFYSPINLSNFFRLGLRLHHKIICVDKQYAMVGGINISDNYSSYTHQKTWLDFAVFIQGNLLIDLYQICLQSLGKARIKKKKSFQFNFKSDLVKETILARVLQNNWSQAKLGITKQYKSQIKNANNQITLVASYFVPSHTIKRLLKKAAKRGLNVRIILGAISDVGIAKRASNYLIEDLLNSGITVFEWRESVLHAKLALIDKNIVNIGSYNLNHLSDFGSIECNIEIIDESFFHTTEILIEEIIRGGCDEIKLQQISKRKNSFDFLLNVICYYLFRIMLKSLFFLQNRTGKKITNIKYK